MPQSSLFWTRRRILIASGVLGVSQILKPALAQAFSPNEVMPVAPGWDNEAGTDLNYRIDGYAKVTGAKLYARDVRGTDLDGWPDDTHHAMMVFTPHANKIFEGLDLSVLGSDLQPDTVITARDLNKAGLAPTGFFTTDLFCKAGTVPLYLGQPVAMLIYKDLARFTQARAYLVGNDSIIQYGDSAPAVSADPYGSNRFARIEGDSPLGPDVYSPVKDGWIGPIRYQKNQSPVWARDEITGDASQQASFYGDQIRADLTAGKSGKQYTQTFQTQSIDQVFMEPENGLAWYDPDSRKLSLMLGVQSPLGTLTSVGDLVKSATASYRVDEVDAHFAYIGGGFGGKDHTIIPLYIAIAGIFGDNKTVRLALNRFEQFQFGLKRHAFEIKNQLGVDPDTGQFLAFASDLTCDGGGRANFSASVADVGATAASSIYYMPKSDVITTAVHSIGVAAGSMRGFGTFQTMTAMECLVDEVAENLGKDPFELRRLNAMRTGQLNLTGNTASGAVRVGEVLDAMERSDLWQSRNEDKAAYETEHPGKSYGVGIACVMKDFGSGGDATLGSVSLSPDGTITVGCGAIEMGTGISTAVARRVSAYLGRNADTVMLDQQHQWDALKLETSGSPWSISQADQDTASRNPRWVPIISSPSSASIGASVSSHGPSQAAYVIMRFGLWPAALSIWSEGPLGGEAAGQFITFDKLRWVDGNLTGAGMEPLPLQQLAARAHQDGLVTGAMVHGFNRWSWASATFSLGNETFTTSIDALAIQSGSDAWMPVDRLRVDYPPASFERIGVNYYAACGAVVALGVDKVSGDVAVEAVHQVLECGTSIVPELVSGISQGGIAMGIGHALHEYLPQLEGGPGDGTWNLNRYIVPKAGQVPVWKTTLEVLPPLSETDPPKGMAEVVMIPVVPAILNGINNAVGARIRSLPATPEKILEAL
jgi:CO/xanthine dehydrogenase Mo-binding subunit